MRRVTMTGAIHGAALLFGSLILSASAAQADVVISTQPTANMTCTGGMCVPTAKKAVLNVTDLANMLASGDVIVQSGSLAQDIDVDAALSWTSTRRLTLDSYHSIDFTKPVVVAGQGAMTITTNDGGASGDFYFEDNGRVQFWDLTSSLIINGQRYLLYDNVTKLKQDLRHGGGGAYYALAKNVDSKRHYTASVFPNFGSTFEGLGNTISNLTIANGANRTGVGLFEGLADFGIIRDINLTRVNVAGYGLENGVGALVGSNTGTILNAHADGVVSANGSNSYAGGLAGDNEEGLIARSTAAVDVSLASGAFAVGGFVGANDGTLDQDYATGSVTADDGTSGGGLVGLNLGGTVSNSYASASVVGGNSAVVGGLVGMNTTGDSGNPLIYSSYSTSAVTAGSNATVGGMLGSDIAEAQNVSDYWDLDTSGIGDASKGAGNIMNDPGITGLTTEQFTSGLPAGFDKAIWKEKAKLNSGYPYLLGNPPQ